MRLRCPRTLQAILINVHLHCLGLDGVYVRFDDGELGFHPLPTPTSAEAAEIARRTATRLHQAFREQGRSSPWDGTGAFDSEEPDPLSRDQPGLFACYEAAASGIAVSGQPVLRLVAGGGAETADPSPAPPADQPAAEASASTSTPNNASMAATGNNWSVSVATSCGPRCHKSSWSNTRDELQVDA